MTFSSCWKELGCWALSIVECEGLTGTGGFGKRKEVGETRDEGWRIVESLRRSMLKESPAKWRIAMGGLHTLIQSTGVHYTLHIITKDTIIIILFSGLLMADFLILHNIPT